MERHPPRILVIDDDRELVATLKDAFEANRYDVDGAATGEDGLSLCRDNAYDVLLIDIKLPDMDGLSLIRRLSWQSQPSDCIVITGHASLETAIGAAGEQRVAAFERKPLDMERLLTLINQIVQRRQTERALRRSEERLLQAEKLEAIGRLAGGIAHDFNNILTVILGNLDLLRMTTSEGASVQDEIGEISDAAIRASDLTRQLLAFSRKQIIAPRAIDLNDVIADMKTMLKRLIREDIRIDTFLSSGLPSIKVDPTQVQQVVLNLAINARDAMLYGGELAIETKSVLLDEEYRRTHPSVEPGPYVMLTVSDTGEGMDKETLSHIFEPFYTTKEMGRGLGLGLSTVYGIVEQSGGHVTVNSEKGNGSCFRTYFPAVGEKATLVKETIETGEPPESATQGHGESILVVDDEEALAGLIKRVLRSAGYKVQAARNAGEAIATCLDMGRSLDLLLTDLVMPDMGGRDLAESVSNLCPHLKVLFMSGYSENPTGHVSTSDDGIEFINKPFGAKDLVRRIEALLAK